MHPPERAEGVSCSLHISSGGKEQWREQAAALAALASICFYNSDLIYFLYCFGFLLFFYAQTYCSFAFGMRETQYST